MNLLLLTALEALPKPWTKPETAQLVARILETSPDLIKYCFNKWQASLEPRESPLWTDAISFITKIISSVHLDFMNTSDALTGLQLQNALRAILLAPCVLKHVASALAADQPASIKSHGLQVLSAIIGKLNQIKSEQVLKNLKQMLRVLIPSAVWICDLWNDSGFCGTVGDFLLSLAKLELTMLDDPRKVCKTLIKAVEAKDAKVQSAVLQTISLMDPTFLAPDSERFEEALFILL